LGCNHPATWATRRGAWPARQLIPQYHQFCAYMREKFSTMSRILACARESSGSLASVPQRGLKAPSRGGLHTLNPLHNPARAWMSAKSLPRAPFLSGPSKAEADAVDARFTADGWIRSPIPYGPLSAAGRARNGPDEARGQVRRARGTAMRSAHARLMHDSRGLEYEIDIGCGRGDDGVDSER
jgi:hypothetical protein